jgi:3-oxoacyl-[acyl-carrier-protein] synthase II
MGHTMGSCGVIETIIILYLMSEGMIPPTLNLDKVDEQCAMIKHVITPQDHHVRTAAIQNFAFGGVNTNLIIKKLE